LRGSITGFIGERLDEVIVRRAQRGDSVALDHVARALLQVSRRWARTHVPDPDDADDVAQAAVIAALRALASFRAHARLETWFYRIVRRCAADHHRRVRSQARLLDRQAALAAGHTALEQVDPDVERNAALVRVAFHELPGRQREVFDLIELQGRTTDDVATLLSVAPATVRVHLMRARQTLRQRILDRTPACVQDHDGL
jgi:RNA polymerase sigma-70 factor (ECF subfamily)